MIRHYANATEMAKTLVTYMSDAKAIRAAIMAEYLAAPSIQSINAYRGAYLRSVDRAKRGKRIGSHDKHETPSPGTDWQRELASVSDELATAIWREHAPMLLACGVTPPWVRA